MAVIVNTMSHHVSPFKVYIEQDTFSRGYGVSSTREAWLNVPYPENDQSQGLRNGFLMIYRKVGNKIHWLAFENGLPHGDTMVKVYSVVATVDENYNIIDFRHEGDSATVSGVGADQEAKGVTEDGIRWTLRRTH